MNARWARYAVLAGIAVVFGSALTLELYFNSRAEMMPVDLVALAIPQFGRALLWAVWAPFILQLREKMPLTGRRWPLALVFHLAASFVMMATFYVGRMWSMWLLFKPSSPSGFWALCLDGFYGHNLVDIVYYWGVIGAGFALELQQKYKHEELKAAQLETRLVESELSALRQQLHPHFLFNTLNTISVLIRERRHDDAVTLVARLSALLRLTLDNTGVAEVTLQQELDFLQHYVEIQQARFSDRLTVVTDITSEAKSARIPNLLLQPIVENAILHGIAPKAGPGRVEIRGHVESGRLHLEVRDDGDGLPDEPNRTREGVGLANTRERLSRIYGARSQLLLHSERGRGVSVQIIFPFRS